jgi:transcriptional regulator with XRE-family HTH domain
MEFNEKLQELRKKKGLTQEELGEALFVSRTAISKWESGRGYPNIDSLKDIAKFFSVSIDELLSSDEILTIAQKEEKKKAGSFRDCVFGVLDVCLLLLLVLPFLAERSGDVVQEVSLIALTEIRTYVKVLYFLLLGLTACCGIVTLALQNLQTRWWVKSKSAISLSLSAATVLAFIVSLQPYAAIFTFALVVVKVFFLIKRQ